MIRSQHPQPSGYRGSEVCAGGLHALNSSWWGCQSLHHSEDVA